MSEANNGAGRVTLEQTGNVFLIGLDRAGKRNAFDSAMMTDLSLALGEYERTPDLRCAVIFAHGEHFTSGLDLMELAPKLASGGFSYPEAGIDPWGVEKPRRQRPVVVAIQGTCWTAGIELMLNADVVVAANTARFAHLEVLRGIAPSGGSTVRFTHAAGWVNAMRYMLTGEPFDAPTALGIHQRTKYPTQMTKHNLKSLKSYLIYRLESIRENLQYCPANIGECLRRCCSLPLEYRTSLNQIAQ